MGVAVKDFRGWIGVDFDGTLVMDNPDGFPSIGAPIPKMVNRVKGWLESGREVRIFTARVGPCTDEDVAAVGLTNAGGDTAMWWIVYQRRLLEEWCEIYLGQKLTITATKDFNMVELWDDRAVQVVSNTGMTLAEDRLLLGKRG